MTAEVTPLRTPLAIARAIATAVTALYDVVGLYSGALGEIATYGDGERVGGVRIHSQDPPRVEVHIVVRYGRPLPDVAADVRTVVRDLLATGGVEPTVDVRIGDLDTGAAP